MEEQKDNKTVKEMTKEERKEKKIYSVRKETKWKAFLRCIIKNLINGFYHIVFRIKIVGEPVPKEGAYIICANHINYFDAVAVVTSNKRRVYFIAKEDLFHNGFLNWLAHIFDVIPVKRGKQDLESMKRSLAVLKRGDLLGLFPEGTRKGIAKNGKIKNGAAFMALRTGVPVIPLGIQGTFKPFKKTILNYGKPLDFSKYQSKTPDKEVLEEVSNEIMNNIIMLTNEGK